MSKLPIRQRYLVLTWRQNHGEQRWFIWRATVVKSVGSAKRLRTINQRYCNLRTAIIAEQILEGIGELTEPLKRRDWIVKNVDLEKLQVRTAKQ